MNKKGFGVLELLAFIAFAGIALIVLFSFIRKNLNLDFLKSEGPANYKNVYAVYIKEHNINFYMKNN